MSAVFYMLAQLKKIVKVGQTTLIKLVGSIIL